MRTLPFQCIFPGQEGGSKQSYPEKQAVPGPGGQTCEQTVESGAKSVKPGFSEVILKLTKHLIPSSHPGGGLETRLIVLILLTANREVPGFPWS